MALYIHVDTDQDFHYLVDYDTDMTYDCEANHCDMICRCGQIVSFKVNPLSPYRASELVKHFTKGKLSELEQYLAERLLRWAFRSDMFEGFWSHSWYGDEVNAVKIDQDSEGWHDFSRKIETFNRLPTYTDQVRMILTLEYSYLLPEVAAIEEWEVRSLPLKDVHASKETMARIKTDVAQGYADFPPDHGVQGVAVQKDDGSYKLVDGFHRYAAWTGIVKPRWSQPKKKGKRAKHRKIKVLVPA